MKCRICGQEVVLIPSARERAAKYGGTPAEFTALFPEHSACTLRKRKEETLELIRRNNRA